MKNYIYIHDTNSNEEFTLEESEFREYAVTYVEGVETSTATLEEIFSSLICAEINCEIKQLNELGITFLFKLNVEENVTSYEFEVFDSIRQREIDVDISTFRLDINNVTKEWEVFEAFDSDYDIGIDVTYLFSEELLQLLENHLQTKGDLQDDSESYHQYYATVE